MASPSDPGVSTMTVCLNCGDKGEAKLLIYCVKCRDSAVHHYCLDQFSPDNNNHNWMCEECAPKVGPFRKSERISLKQDRAIQGRINWKRMLNKNGISKAKRSVPVKYSMAEAAQLTDDCSLPTDEMNKEHSSDRIHRNQEQRRNRRIMVEDGEDPREQLESVKAKAYESAPRGPCLQLNISYCRQSLESNNYVYAQPVIDPIWRGCFSMCNEIDETLPRMMAHLSSKACSKVSDAATALPPVLDFEIAARCDVWPKRFHLSPPTDDSIALYFFPESERDEKKFDGLINDIIENNLALKAIIDDVELLIFSSLELPREHWRFRRKYYLWGVFRAKQKHYSVALVPTNHPVIHSMSADRVTPPKPTNTGTQCVKGPGKTTSPWSP